MSKPMTCTADQRDESGLGHCACSLVTATGGTCAVFGPPPTFAEAFPYLPRPTEPRAESAETEEQSA